MIVAVTMISKRVCFFFSILPFYFLKYTPRKFLGPVNEEPYEIAIACPFRTVCLSIFQAVVCSFSGNILPKQAAVSVILDKLNTIFLKKVYKYFRNWWNLWKIRDILDILYKWHHKSHGLQNTCSCFVAQSAVSSDQITGFLKGQYLKNELDAEVKCTCENRYPQM